MAFFTPFRRKNKTRGSCVRLLFLIVLTILIAHLCGWLSGNTIETDSYTDQLLHGLYVPSSIVNPRKATTTKAIPPILHQSWKTTDVPTRFSHWRESWKEHNPDWHLCLWTDEDNFQLVKDFVPWFLKRFESFPENIHRADSSRYIYMYIFGGFYADLDMECLRSHDPLREKDAALFGLMSNDFGFEHNVPNAWFASPPRHPFWLHLLERINATVGHESEYGVEALTGPVQLFHALREYEELHKFSNLQIEKLDAGLIYPYDWHDQKGVGGVCSAQSGGFSPEECKAKLDPEGKAYTITYWSHTWGDSASLERMNHPLNVTEPAAPSIESAEIKNKTPEDVTQPQETLVPSSTGPNKPVEPPVDGTAKPLEPVMPVGASSVSSKNVKDALNDLARTEHVTAQKQVAIAPVAAQSLPLEPAPALGPAGSISSAQEGQTALPAKNQLRRKRFW